MQIDVGTFHVMFPSAFLAAIILISPSPLQAQGVEDARPVPECTECTIVFDSVAVLGASQGDGTIRGPSAVLEDAMGRFIVAQGWANEPAGVFQPDGSFIARIGNIGDGPGEYRSVRALSVVEDAIYLYDEGTQRISTVDHDLEFQESIPLKGFGLKDGLAVSPDLHVVNMLVPDGASTGYALHLVNGEGDVVRSMEVHDGRSGDPTAHFRHLIRDTDGDGFWSVSAFGRVTVRRYSANGELLTEWSAAPSPGDDLPMSYGNPDEDRPPTRRILAAWHDDGLIWVVSSIPGPRWREGLERTEDEYATSFRPTDPDLVYDAAIEVFDAGSSRLVAAQYDEPLLADLPVGPGLAAKMTTDELGWIYLHIRRVRLVHPASP